MIVSSDEGQPEVFYTLQGEGISCGQPAVFVRLSNCNLSCVWCDTPYTWNFERTKSDHPEKYVKKEQQTEVAVEELRELINSKTPDGAILVITGGEPMLQQKEIAELIYGGKLKSSRIEIETNGTIAPNGLLVAKCHFNVSLKLSNAGMTTDKRLRSEAIKMYAQAKSIFKFVVDSVGDLEEIKGIVERYKIENQLVWLMPQGRSPEELNEKLEWLAGECMANGFNLTNRLHVQTWGAKRGV